ncbi:putative mycolyltransferase [Gordonia hirsuta DSM 44140 = NBRC 16056]|uniref:Putative mycolyltransferase n=1 Tax=Gordonia hirsuta DSM 44140 = NBRC 16056 TaxID=1121927 RepID=L7LEW4_9ACTN|nr:alpha/beta hydrolase family protein [Gordonia hirsuta]GAC58583.1 putative mycolyltransferase [Gordonia hirsuta DSM 44140 = NBRC 16056]
MTPRRFISILAAVTVAFGALAAPAEAFAAPPGAKVLKKVQRGLHRTDLNIKSRAMGGTVPVTVLSPGGPGPRGTLYLLDGADGGDEVSDWITKGGAAKFFAGQNVNVVLPAGGAGSFYTDWMRKDAKLGKPQWETFLTEELPPVIAEQFGANGRNAVMGLSMGGQSAFALATRHPQLYRGVASLSGCPPVSSPANEAYVRTTVAKAGGDANNMWGPSGAKRWRSHDPSLKLDALRGKAIFLGAGSGAVGPLDFTVKRDPAEGPEDAQIAAGSALEIGAYRCSLEFATKLTSAGIAFTPGFRLIGTHNWAYWKQDLPEAWRAIAPAIA